MSEITLYRKYRPRSLKTVVGQSAAVASLQKLIETDRIPNAILFTGPSGCGKTTLARILKNHLKCDDYDFQELNVADFRGIDMVRDIRRTVTTPALSGGVRVWLLDECGLLTKDAQSALLKILEDTPQDCYFFLATTDPQKLLKTILTRCAEVKMVSLKEKDLRQVLERVIAAEKFKVSPTVMDEIVDSSEGSARKALVILGQVALLSGDDAQIEAIHTTTLNSDAAFALARALMDPRMTWPEVAIILRNLVDSEPESVRYMVLGYARSCLIGKEGKPLNQRFASRAFMVIDIFKRNFYDSKAAGLAAACFEVINPVK